MMTTYVLLIGNIVDGKPDGLTMVGSGSLSDMIGEQNALIMFFGLNNPHIDVTQFIDDRPDVDGMARVFLIPETPRQNGTIISIHVALPL